MTLFQAEHEQMAFANGARRPRSAPANTEFTAFCIGLTPFANIQTPVSVKSLGEAIDLT